MERNPRDNPLSYEMTKPNCRSLPLPVKAPVFIPCPIWKRSIVGRSFIIDMAIAIGIVVFASSVDYILITIYESVSGASTRRPAPVEVSDINDNYSYRNTGNE
jgi:hypothetical protein